jgi:hypothetical protein
MSGYFEIPYRVDTINYWVATDRYDLTAEQIAIGYKLSWNIATLFTLWKQHFKVCHLMARSRYGLLVQLLGVLITYILLICCHNGLCKRVSIKRVRDLGIKIKNETHDIERMSRHGSKMTTIYNSYIHYM